MQVSTSAILPFFSVSYLENLQTTRNSLLHVYARLASTDRYLISGTRTLFYFYFIFSPELVSPNPVIDASHAFSNTDAKVSPVHYANSKEREARSSQ